MLCFGHPSNSHVPLDASTYKKTHIIETWVTEEIPNRRAWHLLDSADLTPNVREPVLLCLIFSAGLPVVFSTLLSCEPTSGQTPLLKQSMESLLETAASPLPTVIDEHIDLPQV